LIVLGVLLSPGLAGAQTVQVPTLSLDGARAVLHAAEEKAQQLTAPSSLAVVNPEGDLILFEQMQGARPIGIELAIGKARSAALFQLPTQTLEAAINTGRPAAITGEQVQMQGASSSPSLSIDAFGLVLSRTRYEVGLKRPKIG
jgi:glc operon protein GlcG